MATRGVSLILSGDVAHFWFHAARGFRFMLWRVWLAHAERCRSFAELNGKGSAGLVKFHLATHLACFVFTQHKPYCDEREGQITRFLVYSELHVEQGAHAVADLANGVGDFIGH
eukprot:40882-Pleurochrysis_carterae.AAC.2